MYKQIKTTTSQKNSDIQTKMNKKKQLNKLLYSAEIHLDISIFLLCQLQDSIHPIEFDQFSKVHQS